MFSVIFIMLAWLAQFSSELTFTVNHNCTMEDVLRDLYQKYSIAENASKTLNNTEEVIGRLTSLVDYAIDKGRECFLHLDGYLFVSDEQPESRKLSAQVSGLEKAVRLSAPTVNRSHAYLTVSTTIWLPKLVLVANYTAGSLFSFSFQCKATFPENKLLVTAELDRHRRGCLTVKKISLADDYSPNIDVDGFGWFSEILINRILTTLSVKKDAVMEHWRYLGRPARATLNRLNCVSLGLIVE